MKRETVIFTPTELTEQERRNFKKDHPGKRLCFRLRYPKVPQYTRVAAISLIIIALFLALH